MIVKSPPSLWHIRLQVSTQICLLCLILHNKIIHVELIATITLRSRYFRDSDEAKVSIEHLTPCSVIESVTSWTLDRQCGTTWAPPEKCRVDTLTKTPDWYLLHSYLFLKYRRPLSEVQVFFIPDGHKAVSLHQPYAMNSS